VTLVVSGGAGCEAPVALVGGRAGALAGLFSAVESVLEACGGCQNALCLIATETDLSSARTT
jgi:hypothetical protein